MTKKLAPCSHDNYGVVGVYCFGKNGSFPNAKAVHARFLFVAGKRLTLKKNEDGTWSLPEYRIEGQAFPEAARAVESALFDAPEFNSFLVSKKLPKIMGQFTDEAGVCVVYLQLDVQSEVKSDTAALVAAEQLKQSLSEADCEFIAEALGWHELMGVERKLMAA